MSAVIDTATQVERMRRKIIRPSSKQLLMSKLAGSDQESDLQSPVNCGGLGRIRHFKRGTHEGWPSNFLPIDPAARALGLLGREGINAQVFQNAACAWRCWYCFVPFELLGGNERLGEWVTADELVTRYAALDDRPPVLDLSGGSPDLTPEWVVWTAEALQRLGIAQEVYLWSDDNLSTDLTMKLLSEEDWETLRSINYGKVCCFKGFDSESFAFNTGADGTQFEKQFERFAAYAQMGIDLYAYVTFTGPDPAVAAEHTKLFVERLEKTVPGMMARTVPLRIEIFGATMKRKTTMDRDQAFRTQEVAIETWSAMTQNSSAA